MTARNAQNPTFDSWERNLSLAIQDIGEIDFSDRIGYALGISLVGCQALATNAFHVSVRRAFDSIAGDPNIADPRLLRPLRQIFMGEMGTLTFPGALAESMKSIRASSKYHRLGIVLAMKRLIEGSFIQLADISCVVGVMGEELTYFQTTCTEEGSERVAAELEACMTILQARIGALPEGMPPTYQIGQGPKGTGANT